MQILVIQTAFVGDLFLSIPLLKQISALFENSQITLVCRKGLGDFFSQTDLVTEVVEVQKGDRSSYASAIDRLKIKNFQYIFCPHQSFRSALLVSRLRCEKEKIGFSNFWNPLIFHKTVKRPEHLPDALRQLSLLTTVNEDFKKTFESYIEGRNIWNSKVKSELVDFRSQSIPSWASAKLEKQLPLTGRNIDSQTIFLAPGSVWATKMWLTTGYIEVAKKLVERGSPVVLLGSLEEHKLCEEIRKSVPGLTNLAGQTTLSESVALMQRGRALVANDSGAIHLAAAAGLPTVAVFGPTTLDIGYRPWIENSIVVQKGLDCRPCGRHGHQKCPIGTHDCMKKISSSEVLAALDQLILQ